jgi:hypothetical protein
MLHFLVTDSCSFESYGIFNNLKFIVDERLSLPLLFSFFDALAASVMAP